MAQDSKPLNLTLIVNGLTLEDAKKLARVILEISEGDPTKLITCTVHGLDKTPKEEAKRILLEIFPRGGVAA